MKPYSRSLSRSRRHGFSLAELMVVIVILGLIATLVVPELFGRFFRAQSEKAKIDITAICQAVDTFALENNGKFPESLEMLVTPDVNGRTYLKGRTTVPLDPWRNPYGFEPPSAGRDYRVFSLGKDGASGGEGENADIDNVSMLNETQR